MTHYDFERQLFFSLTAVPEALSAALARAARDVGSAVDGRLALFARFGATVVDAPVAVDGLAARREEKAVIYL
jgi:hypothetical protein